MIVALVLAAALMPAEDAAQARRHLERGAALFAEGRIEEARAAFQQSLAARPSARAWKGLGVISATQQDYLQAQREFQQACRMDPREADACFFLARACYALDQYEAALAALELALAIDAKPWRIHSARGQALEALGRSGEAEQAFRKGLAAVPPGQAIAESEDPRIHYGVFLLRQGRMPEAAAHFERQSQALAGVARFHYEFGRVLLQLDRVSEAAQRLEQAVRLKPAMAEAHWQLAQAYAQLGKTELAERHRAAAAAGSRTLK